MNTQLFSFLAVGGSVNLTAIAMFHVFTEFLGFNQYFCLILLFIVGTYVSYYLNSRYTFKTDKKSITSIVQFYLIYISAVALQAGALYVGDTMNIHQTISYISGIILTVASNFLLLKFVVFR